MSENWTFYLGICKIFRNNNNNLCLSKNILKIIYEYLSFEDFKMIWAYNYGNKDII